VCQNEDIVATDAKLVGWGKWCQVRSGGPTLHAVRRPATNVVLAARARRSTADPTFPLANTKLRLAASRSHVAAARVLLQSSNKPARYPIDIRDRLERKLLRMSTILLFVGSVGWCWPVLSELRSLISVSPAVASIHPHVSYCQRLNRCRGKADSEIGKLDPFNKSIYAPSAARHVTRRSGTRPRSRERRQDRRSRTERHADAICQTQPNSRGETHSERAEAELEAVGPSSVARRLSTARGGQPLAHPIQRRHTDKSRRFRDGALPVSR
jgi:hypothetical protein